MIRVCLYEPRTRALDMGGLALIEKWRERAGALLWVDICEEPSEAERTLLVADFGLEPSAVEDSFEVRRPPKIEITDGSLFMLLRGLDAKTESIDFGVLQIGLFVGDRFLITRHTLVSPSANALWQQIAEHAAIMGATSDASPTITNRSRCV